MSVANPGMHLQNFILDQSSSPEQKAECLKLLKTVIKNLADPAKARNEKYRKLRLQNDRIQQKLVPYPHALEYLKAIGFGEEMTTQEEGPMLVMNSTPDTAWMQSSLMEVSNALDMVQPAASRTIVSRSSSSSLSGEEKKVEYEPKLSEKQKARQLLEKKRERERLEDKKARARNVKMLKQDKYVRQNDPNWKSGVSAACTKSGDGISTFRDKYGEN